MVAPIDLGQLGVQRGRPLIIGKPCRLWRVSFRSDPHQRIMCLHQRRRWSGFRGLVHGHDSSPPSCVSYSWAWASNAPAADSMAAKTHHGKVVAVAICRHAAATAQDAAAISRAAVGSPLPDRAVASQAWPYRRYATSQARTVLSDALAPLPPPPPPAAADRVRALLCGGPVTGRAVGRSARSAPWPRVNSWGPITRL